MRIAGKPPAPPWDKIAGVYRTGDGRCVRLHTNFPAPPRRHAEAARLRLRARGGAGRARSKWEGEQFETAAAEAGLVATMMRSPRRMGRAPARPGAWRSCRCWRSARSARRRPAPLPAAAERPLVGHPRARPDARHRRAGVRPHAGRARRRRACASRRRICRRCPLLDIDTGRGKLSASLDLRADEDARAAGGAAARGARLRAGLSPGRARRARLLARGLRRDPARHRRGHAVGLRPRRALGSAARLRLAGAERERHQPRRGRGRRRLPRPKELPCPGARSRLGLPDGVRGDDGARRARPARAGRGTCACLPGADRPLACRARTPRERLRLSRSQPADIADLLDPRSTRRSAA